MRDVLQLLGLAHRARRIELGESPVSYALKDGRAVLVLLASDAAANSARRAASWAEYAGVPAVTLEATKAELGAALGRESLAMAALTDAGLAESALKRLDPRGELKEAHAFVVSKLPRKKRRGDGHTTEDKQTGKAES